MGEILPPANWHMNFKQTMWTFRQIQKFFFPVSESRINKNIIFFLFSFLCCSLHKIPPHGEIYIFWKCWSHLVRKFFTSSTYKPAGLLFFIKIKYFDLPEHVCLITEERTPSDHSFVFRSNSPYNSPRDNALGFRGNSLCKITIVTI